jgi:hypothetical protein
MLMKYSGLIDVTRCLVILVFMFLPTLSAKTATCSSCLDCTDIEIGTYFVLADYCHHNNGCIYTLTALVTTSDNSNCVAIVSMNSLIYGNYTITNCSQTYDMEVSNGQFVTEFICHNTYTKLSIDANIVDKVSFNGLEYLSEIALFVIIFCCLCGLAYLALVKFYRYWKLYRFVDTAFLGVFRAINVL